MRISQLRNLTIATFLVSIGCIVTGLWIWQMPTEDLSARKIMKWEPNAAEVIKSENSAAKFTGMKEGLTRPIFRRSRKPFVPEELVKLTAPVVPIASPAPPPPPTQVVEQVPVAPPPPPQTAESLQLSLKGIYSFNGVWRALFVSPSLPQGEWLGIGSDVSGWKLTKVDPNIVTISSGDQKIELKLYVDNQLNVLGTQQP
jgi:hypothetical protein